MSTFRSEEMGYFHIAMSKESAYEVLNFLGESDTIQFVDMNSHDPMYHRAFAKDIKRNEDLEIKLDQIRKEMTKRHIPITFASDIKQFLHKLNEYLNSREKPEYTFIDEIEQEVNERSQLLFDQTNTLENLKDQRNQLIEQRAVLQQCKSVIADNNYFGPQNNDDEEGGFQFSSNLGLGYLCGTILTDDCQRFKKIIFRTTKGNNWTITSPMEIPKPEQGEFDIDLEQDSSKRPIKSIFMIVYTSGNNNFVKNKLNRICDVFNTQRFGLPANQQGFIKKISEIDIQIKEIEKLIHLTEQKIRQLLYEWSLKRGEKLPGDNNAQQICSLIEEIRLFIVKEKQIWIQMNHLDYKSSIYNGYFWCPLSEQKRVRDHVKGLQVRKPHLPPCNIESFDIPSHLTPPTHFRLNEFTATFQQIVDTYGVPRYREINPGFFVPAMFPFKFGVMFGDIGHGGLLFLGGIALCQKKDEIAKTSLAPLLETRYLVLLMGFFAFYCGIIYNDFFSLTFNFFGSCFENQEDGTTKQIPGCVYPVGFDPKWYIASNELTFFNSFKMKAAVIIGVIQMGWGVIIKGWNALNFRNWLDFYFEFIPQIVFLMVTFGYMDFLIIYKWLSDFTGEISNKAPSIINQMINLPLKMGSTEGYPLWEQESQEYIQINLLYVSLACVPIMLLIKPLILLCQNAGKNSKKKQSKQDSKKKPLLSDSDQGLAESLKEQSKKAVAAVQHQPGHGGGHGGHGHGDEFQFGEIMVHQIIETIEFVLGAISNTASYLRLWALSLAHSQLAKVFFEKSIGGGILSSSVISTMIGWVLFVNITLGVIMAMDLMECFLHAIRLQWVEFQGKFFKGDGNRFTPFSFTRSISDAQALHKEQSEQI